MAKKSSKKPRSKNEDLIVPTDTVKDHGLAEDGHVVSSGSVKVVRKGSKVYDGTQVIASEDTVKGDDVGRKTDNSRYELSSLRKRFSFSWNALGRKLLVFAIIFGGLGVIGTSAVAAWAFDQYNKAPSIDQLASRPPESSVVYARDGETVLFEFFQAGTKREILDLCTVNADGTENTDENCISRNIQLAVIAIEHKDFYVNENGIPWRNIIGASWRCLVNDGECRGASGLSQQLIKNITGDDEQTISRKIRELFTAIKLSRENDETEILQMYLNQVAFGRNSNGVQQAAKGYFDKDAKDLTVTESCYLAALIQLPERYNQALNDTSDPFYTRLLSRKNECLDVLANESLAGDGSEPLITAEVAAAGTEQDIILIRDESERQAVVDAGNIPVARNIVDYPFPHFREFVIEELAKFDPIIKEEDLYTRGYRIVTTIDPTLQTDLERVINEEALEHSIPGGANNASAVVIDGPTGEIRAMIGSLDYNNDEIDGQVNIATTPQQPGSSIKPYVYAAAFEQNFNPGTVLLDAKTTFGTNYTPRNFDGKFQGPVTIRSALQNSLNIPAVKAAYLAAGETSGPDAVRGINNVFDFAEKAGVEFPCVPIGAEAAKCADPDQAKDAYRSRCSISAALGGCELSLVSHTAGYNTFAQDGTYYAPTPFLGIYDNQGEDIYEKLQNSSNPIYERRAEAIDPLIARQVSNVLSDYDSRRFGTLGSNLQLPGWTGENAIAAKTGTTDSVRDTWTVGYTPNYTVGLWVGNTDNSQLSVGSSLITAAPVWNGIMQRVHEGIEPNGFSREGLIATRLDAQTGLLTNEGGRIEYLTPKQRRVLDSTGANVGRPENGDPRDRNIFANRTVVIPTVVEVNKLDGKLAVKDKTLEENIEEREFLQVVSEFPQLRAWQAPADALMEASEIYNFPPTEESDQDQRVGLENPPTLTSNLDDDRSFVSGIQASSQAASEFKQITSMSIEIDGDNVANSEGGNITFTDITQYGTQTVDVVVSSTDSQGKEIRKTYRNVTFARAFSASDISSQNVSCSSEDPGDDTTCSINLPNGRSYPVGGIQITIGSEERSDCSNNSPVRCTGVATPTTPGSYPIHLEVNRGQKIQSNSNYIVVAASNGNDDRRGDRPGLDTILNRIQ